MCTVVQHMSGKFWHWLCATSTTVFPAEANGKKGDTGAMDLEFCAVDCKPQT